MKQYVARKLRKMADRLDPSWSERVERDAFSKIKVTYNGVTADAVVTALRQHARRNGRTGIV